MPPSAQVSKQPTPSTHAARPTSIYYTDEAARATHVRWPVPLGGISSFYTTWNAAAGVLITILALILIPWMRRHSTTQKIAAFTIVPLCIAVMASIVCTAIISQMLFAFNVKVERSADEPDEHKDKTLALGISFVKKMLYHNFVWHLSILVLAVVLGLCITFMPSPSTLLGRGSVFLMSFLYLTVFALAWMLTPCDLEPEEGKPPITVVGWDKIKHIYRNPPSYYFSVVFVFVALLVLLVGNFALYGALDQKGMHSF